MTMYIFITNNIQKLVLMVLGNYNVTGTVTINKGVSTYLLITGALLMQQ